MDCEVVNRCVCDLEALQTRNGSCKCCALSLESEKSHRESILHEVQREGRSSTGRDRESVGHRRLGHVKSKA